MKTALRTIVAGLAFAAVAAPIGLAVVREERLRDAAELLEDIRTSDERVGYEGIRTVEIRLGDGPATIRLEVRREPGSRPVIKRLGPEGEAPRARGLGFLRGPAARARFSDPDLILRNYRLEPDGGDRVAGREADRFRLVPLHRGRPSYECAVDREHRFMLTFRAVSPDGTDLYGSSFESIRFIPAGPSKRRGEPRRRGGRLVRQPVRPEDLRGAMDFEVWFPSWLPPGFQRRSLDLLRIPGEGEAVVDVYSDGMTALILVQVSADNASWRFFRGLIGLDDFARPSEAASETVVRRVRHPSGGVLLDLTLEGTDVQIFGQIDPVEMERVAAYLVKGE